MAELQRMLAQVPLSKRREAVLQATANGAVFDTLIDIVDYELTFGNPRNPGDLPALIQAVYQGC